MIIKSIFVFVALQQRGNFSLLLHHKYVLLILGILRSLFVSGFSQSTAFSTGWGWYWGGVATFLCSLNENGNVLEANYDDLQLK